jgi:hypothetical protein
VTKRALKPDGASNFTRQNNLDERAMLRHQTGLFQHQHVDYRPANHSNHPDELHVCIDGSSETKSTLGQTTRHGHLTAFKADFVKTACTRFLTLVATTAGFSQTRNQYHDQDAWMNGCCPQQG